MEFVNGNCLEMALKKGWGRNRSDIVEYGGIWVRKAPKEIGSLDVLNGLVDESCFVTLKSEHRSG